MQSKQETRHSAILLIGPTASGKTPLGQLLEDRGLWGFRCLHFDFGYELRHAIGAGSVLNASESCIVSRMLQTGALLEDEHFSIARKLLEDFMQRNRIGLNAIIVLNGLPRHVGQARNMQEVIRMLAVVSLECSPGMVMHRIALDTGGDRAGRTDDSLEEVERRLELFGRRTAPLLEYYKTCHVGIVSIQVGPTTSATEMLSIIQKGSRYTTGEVVTT